MFIPLHFWPCRSLVLAFAPNCTQYHELKVKMTIEELKNLAFGYKEWERFNKRNGDGTPAPEESFDLYVDYIYLDTDERRRFAQVSHEYLIEQLQHGEET